MAQYFTERLEKVFHMIFTSYNQEMAQEGLRQLELIVNNQQSPEQTKHQALRNDWLVSTQVHALRGRNLIFLKTTCVPINACTIAFAAVVLSAPYKHCVSMEPLHLRLKRIC